MEHSMTLVVFTFLSQLVIGGFSSLFIIETYKQKISKRSSLFSLMMILAISVVAVIVSVFHLGHPFAAYKAIINFAESWLSREIVFFPLFILFVFIYAFFAKTRKMKQITGWIAVMVGATAIASSAMIYIIPAVPGWNNGMTFAAFFVTSLLLGPIFIQLLLSALGEKLVDFSFYTAVVAAIAILLNVLNISIIKSGIAEAVETAALLTTSPLLWAKIILLVIGFCIAGYSIMNKKGCSLTSVSIIFFGFVIAEFIGRMLFYSSGIHL